jgi:hypothetical protein
MACSAPWRVPRLLTGHPGAAASLGATVAKSQTLPSRSVAICVPSGACIPFGAAVTMVRSCAAVGRGRARWGESRARQKDDRGTSQTLHTRATP